VSTRALHNAPSADLIARFAAIVGPAHALTDADTQAPYLREWRDMYLGKAALILRPGSTAEVAQILALANANRIAVVPQAGNTGLVGGQIPFEHGREIVVSVARMDKVRAVDAAGGSMTVEAGVTLADAQATAATAGRLFPLSLPSEGVCRIGGNLSTNAGGVGVLAYGNMRALTLGLEAVLPDGRIIHGLKTLKKDNTGYDIKDLLIGAEGTLGIITAAVLKLFAQPAERATAFVALARIEDALALLHLADDAAGRGLTAFEFLPRLALEFVTRNAAGARDPFAQVHPWYVLLEISGARADGTAGRELEGILHAATERHLILDAVIASSLTQAADLWLLREGISAAQKPEGGNIKHDISVPIVRIPEFIARGNALVETICPGARPLPVGHFGDGNIHYNIVQPAAMDKRRFLDLWEPMSEAIHGLVADMDGSISAEHGIGRMKRAGLAHFKSPVEMELMRGIKQLFDPNGIMNPGKVL
jgi:FAD/FMN-containing dehydrogenase